MTRRILPYFKYLRPVWFKFFLGIAFGVLFSVSSGLGLPLMAETIFPILFGDSSNAPKWLRSIVESFFGNNTEGGFLILCSFSLPLVMVIRAIGSVGNGYFITYVGTHVIQAIQIDMFKKVQSLPLEFYDNYKTGELTSGVMGYPKRIKGIIVDTSNDLVKQPLTLISAVGFLIYKSVTNESFFTAFIGIISIPFVILIIRKIGNYLAKKSLQLTLIGENFNSWVIESFQSPIEIKSYNMQPKLVERFVEECKKIFILSMKTSKSSLIMSPLIEIISGIALGISLYMGVRSNLGQGEFFALLLALYMAYSPVKRIGGIQNALKTLEAPLDRLEKILFANEEIKSPKFEKVLKKPIKGELCFKNVNFEYETNKPILKDINVNIAGGESVVLVGQSGAGKTTFANLLLRLYDPTEGIITLDGLNLKELNLNELRSQISYVPQTPILFNSTIAENIRVGKNNATDAEIKEAAQLANAHDFIIKTAKGYNTILSERGNSLSGGQRQRIAIARAFLKNAPIVVLDEATSSLDNHSDKLIHDALKKLCKFRTTIMIAHRISTLKNIERHLYFNNGKIEGDGSYNELVSNIKGYENLVKLESIDKPSKID